MATSLFNVKVLSKREAVLVLRLRIISAEQPDFCRSKSFALMLLVNPITRKMVENAPLAQHVSFENTHDLNWASKHVDEYIKECRLFDIENHPLTVELRQLSPKQQRDFWKSARAPRAVFEITATSPIWIEHLNKGMEWETAAFDLIE